MKKINTKQLNIAVHLVCTALLYQGMSIFIKCEDTKAGKTNPNHTVITKTKDENKTIEKNKTEKTTEKNNLNIKQLLQPIKK